MLGFLELVFQPLIQFCIEVVVLEHKRLVRLVQKRSRILVVGASHRRIAAVGVFREIVGIGSPDIHTRLILLYRLAFQINMNQLAGCQRNLVCIQPSRTLFCRIVGDGISGYGFLKLLDQLRLTAFIAAIQPEINRIGTQMIIIGCLIPGLGIANVCLLVLRGRFFYIRLSKVRCFTYNNVTKRQSIIMCFAACLTSLNSIRIFTRPIASVRTLNTVGQALYHTPQAITVYRNRNNNNALGRDGVLLVTGVVFTDRLFACSIIIIDRYFQGITVDIPFDDTVTVCGVDDLDIQVLTR